jgi:hypothetical protein
VRDDGRLRARRLALWAGRTGERADPASGATRFDSLMATLSRREIGLSMWNSLQGEEVRVFRR